MNKEAKVTFLFLWSIVLFSIILLMYFVLAAPEVLFSDGSSIINVNESELFTYNISVNNTDVGAGDNVTIVNITLPENFTFYSYSNNTDATGVFTNTSSVLTWSNSDTLILNGSINYFQFGAIAVYPGWYNITVDVINSSLWGIGYSIGVEVNDTTPASDVSFVTSTTISGNYSQNWIYANVSVIDNGIADTLNITLYNSTSGLVDSYSSNAMRAEHNFTTLTDGTYYLNATFNDSYNNINSSETYTILLDTAGPGTVGLVSPTPSNGTTISSTEIEVNVSASDSLSEIESVVINVHNSSHDVVNSTLLTSLDYYVNYSSMLEGTYYINATANDTLGNSNDTSFTTVVTLDTTYPEITILYPTNTSYSSLQTELNLSFTESNADTCWYTNDSLVNYTITCGDNVTGMNSSEGSNTWIVWINDSAGHTNYTSITFTIDVYPDITLVSPSNNTQSRFDIHEFNCSATSHENINLSSITIYLWNSSDLLDSNLTEVSGPSNLTNFSYNLSSEGAYYWNCLVNDTAGTETWGEENQTMIIDTTVPSSIVLVAPANSLSSAATSHNFTFNVSDNFDVANCSLIINGAVSETITSVSKTATNSIYKTGLSAGTKTWHINCTDVAGNENSSKSRTLTISSGGASSGGGGGGYPIYSINQESFKNGYTRMLQKGWKIQFKVQEQSHTLELKIVSGNEVTIEIKSEPQTATLSVGEEKKFDVTGDDYYDLSVKLEGIVGNSANLTVKSISQNITSETSETTEQPEDTSSTSKEPEESVIAPSDERSATSGKENSKWIFALILVIAIIVVVILILKGNKQKRKKKLFDISYSF